MSGIRGEIPIGAASISACMHAAALPTIPRVHQRLVTQHTPHDDRINNAGNLRDVSFRKMTEQDWHAVLSVHLTGAFKVTKAVRRARETSCMQCEESCMF